MQDPQTYFTKKKVTVMGLGLLGRGVGDTMFLAECGAELIVTDMKSEEELALSLEQLADFSNITYQLGEHNEEDFIGRDMILVAAGVPTDSPFLKIARDAGAMLTMSGALFAELSGIPIIGVTGTRGKSTVTHMIHHVLSQATEDGDVILGGNVRGISNLQLLKDVTPHSLAVMELDSWQLQGFGWAEISPQIAVFTNFMEDHLTYYKGSMDAYFADKTQIFLHQEAGDTLVTTREVFERIQTFMKKERRELFQNVLLVDVSLFPEEVLLMIPGEHNRLNAVLAQTALRAVGLTDEEILPHLATFKGVPGRLEYLGEKEGVKVYNDNNATTPTATLAGLRAVSRGANVVLIVGGTDKEIDLTELTRDIPTYCKAVILYSGTGTEKLKAVLPEGLKTFEYEMLADCVRKAFEEAEEGDVVLFSPAFSSFGKYYKNEYDRGDQFVELITRGHVG